MKKEAFKIPVCDRTEPHDQHFEALPGGVEWTCFGTGKRENRDPEGLTPQEIRLRLVECLEEVPVSATELAETLGILSRVAAWVEHGHQGPPEYRTVACPDPALHNGDGDVLGDT